MLPGAILVCIHLVMSQTLPNCCSGDATKGIGVSKGFTHMKARFAINTHLQSQRRGCGPVCSTGIDAAECSISKNSHPFLPTAPRFPKMYSHEVCLSFGQIGKVCKVFLHYPCMIHGLCKSIEAHGMELFLD